MLGLWMGTDASFEVFTRYEAQFAFDKMALLPTPGRGFDRQEMDPTYGVDPERIGLYLMERVNGTTVIKVHGSLVPSYRRYHEWFPGEQTSYEAITDALTIARDDEDTDRILLDFATPGGAVSGLDVVTQFIDQVRDVKPVNGHTDRSAFSAGYWIMSSCSRLTASRMAEVGSIGTVAIFSHFVDPEKNMGVKFHVLREGENKFIGNRFEELTDAHKKVLQENLAEANQFFLEHVALNRGILLDDKKTWAEGNVFYALRAQRAGLIDEVTTLNKLLTSGTPAKPSGNRSFAMKISAQKLAQITAGADPKDVLTAAELKQYNADLAEKQAQIDADAKKAQEDEAAAAEAAKKKGEGGEGDEGGENEEDPAKNAAAAGASKGLGDELKQALKENGKLEARVESLESQLEKLMEENDATKKASEDLLVVAKAAVKNLQVATGSPLQEKNSVAEVLGQFNELQATMAKLFKTGKNSADEPLEDSTRVTAGQGGGTANWRQLPSSTKKS